MVNRWKMINDNSETCEKLVTKNPILKQFYGDNISDVNIMRGVRAAEMFVTHRSVSIFIIDTFEKLPFAGP